jgi:ankyrin repeat protein
LDFTFLLSLLINLKDEGGWAPLLYAAWHGHKAAVKLLLNLDKVDVDLKLEEGWMPLSYAAKYGNEAIVKILRDNV